jgi:hypothetical protein
VRVIISRARSTQAWVGHIANTFNHPEQRERGIEKRNVACAIPRAAFEALSENRFQAIYCMALTASRCALSRLSGSGRGVETADGEGLRKALPSKKRVMLRAVATLFDPAGAALDSGQHFAKIERGRASS